MKKQIAVMLLLGLYLPFSLPDEVDIKEFVKYLSHLDTQRITAKPRFHTDMRPYFVLAIFNYIPDHIPKIVRS